MAQDLACLASMGDDQVEPAFVHFAQGHGFFRVRGFDQVVARGFKVVVQFHEHGFAGLDHKNGGCLAVGAGKQGLVGQAGKQQLDARSAVGAGAGGDIAARFRSQPVNLRHREAGAVGG